MNNDTLDNMVQAGLALAELGTAAAQKKLQPMEVARAASTVLVAIEGVTLDDLKRFLDEADRARLDAAGELAAEAKIGHRS